MNRTPVCNFCDCGAHAWAPATQFGTVIVDRVDAYLLERFAWHLISPKRLCAYAGSGKAKNHIGYRLLHRAILRLPADETVDHKNGNGLDCRRSNLRSCTQKQNTHNRRGMRGSTSRFRGVSWNSASKKWVAQVSTDGKNCWIGRFETEAAAAAAYDSKARLIFGDFARLNLVGAV